MALNPTRKDLDAFLQPKVRKFRLTSAQILTLHVTPVQNIIAAKPRYIVFPTDLYLMHPAGTAYANASRLNLRYPTGPIVVMSVNVGAGSGFLDGAAIQRTYAPSPSGTAPALLQELLITGAAGQRIDAILSAQVITGTFAVFGLIRYYELPHSLVQS